MSNPTSIDYDRAILNPAATFDRPEDVVHHPELDHAQKVEILERWQNDANELAVAASEGMSGGEPALLGRVTTALESLTNASRQS